MKNLPPYLSLSAVLLLTACGGGGGGSDDGGTVNSSSSVTVSSSSVSSSSSSVSSVSSSSSSEPVTAPENAPGGLTLELQAIKQFHFQWETVASADYYQLYENIDGASGFTLIADNLEATEYQLEVPLYLRTEASYMVQACNVGGCSAASESASVSGNMAEAVGYIKAPMTLGSVMVEGQFGQEYPVSQRFGTVALSGDGSTLAVATNNDLGGEAEANSSADIRFEKGKPAVFVYHKGEAGWERTGKIGDLTSTVSSLDLSPGGELLVIGSEFEDGGSTGINGDEADQSAENSGAAYLYRYNDGWQKEAYVKASNAETYDRFGRSVALSADGSTLAVGAFFEKSTATGVNPNQTGSDNEDLKVGAAYIFTHGEGGWTQQAYIKPIDIDHEFNPSTFGDEVALSEDGSVLAVSASGWVGSGDVTRFSSVDLYIRDEAGQWQAEKHIESPEQFKGSTFGSSVALSADGTRLAVAESFLLIFGDNHPDLRNKGKVHIFSGENWDWDATVVPKGGTKANQFGADIALTASGDLLAVCAPNDSSDSVAIEPDSGSESLSLSGAGYVFGLEEGVWKQRVYIKSPNPGVGDFFCRSLGMSAAGETLAVGAPREAGSATDVGGEFDNNAQDAGAVYIY